MEFQQKALRLTALLGALGIALGALGAHAFELVMTQDQLKSFETGVRYHMLHIPVLLVLALLNRHARSFWLFVAGIAMFSGSIYLLIAGQVLVWPLKWLWPVTPLGGIVLICAWLSLMFSDRKKNERIN